MPDASSAARDDQPRRKFRIACSDTEGNEAAERLPQQDRMLELDRRAECMNVINPVIEVPLFAWAVVASPAGTLVDEDDLRNLLQWREQMLVDGVIKRRATMQDEQHRALAHPGSVGDKTHPDDVKVDADVTYRDTQGTAYGFAVLRGSTAFLALDNQEKRQIAAFAHMRVTPTVTRTCFFRRLAQTADLSPSTQETTAQLRVRRTSRRQHDEKPRCELPRCKLTGTRLRLVKRGGYSVNPRWRSRVLS